MDKKTKKCLIFETLGKVADMRIVESKNNEMRLTGVFGVTGIKNQNNRIYDRKNYSDMVESLQQIIATEGCPGELEHPNSMNINLENVSHKIESIQMNEDGTITGTILLLNTPKGQIARAIVEGGLPLYISSRAQGTITNEGRVTLSYIKTYDLVGTPGFSQAKLTLKENQTLECLNESLEDGIGQTWAIVEDELLDDSDDEDKKKKKSEDEGELLSDSDDKKDDEKSDDEKKKKEEEESEEDTDEKSDDKDDNNKNNDIDKEPDMTDVVKSLNELADEVKALKAELHVAKESLESANEKIQILESEKLDKESVPAIQNWIETEFKESMNSNVEDLIGTESNSIKNLIEEKIKSYVEENNMTLIENVSDGVEAYLKEEYAGIIDKWVTEEFASKIQDWIVEEFAPEVQNWITEEYSPVVEKWITEEYSETVGKYLTEEYGDQISGYIRDVVTPAFEEKITESINESRKKEIDSSFDKIDALLEAVDKAQVEEKSVENVLNETLVDEKYKGIYVIEHMPAEYAPKFAQLNEAQQQAIIATSKMYDFTKQGILESFWSNVDFDAKKVNEEKEENALNPVSNYHKGVFNRMMALRRGY